MEKVGLEPGLPGKPSGQEGQHVHRPSSGAGPASSRNIKVVGVAGTTTGRGVGKRSERHWGQMTLQGVVGTGTFPLCAVGAMGRWATFLKGCLGLLSRERTVGDMGGNREPCEEHRTQGERRQKPRPSGGHGGGGNGPMPIWKVHLTGLAARLDWGGEGEVKGDSSGGPEQPEEWNCHVL